MKYVLDLRLYAGGHYFIILGIGPGVDYISPHFCSITCIILCRFLFLNWIFFYCERFLRFVIFICYNIINFV